MQTYFKYNKKIPGLCIVIFFIFSVITFGFTKATVDTKTHVWETVEIKLTAENSYSNPYMDVDVWVQLKGPDFNKRIYGFWDGDNIFRVRVVATAPGMWTWTSGSNQKDKGLNNTSGSFEAVEWTEAEKEENPNRRGIIRTNGHILEYADGTPFFLLADTHWASFTWRYPFKGAKPDAGIGFEEFIHCLKSKGFNSVAIIGCFPNWKCDRYFGKLKDNSGCPIRDPWKKPGQKGKSIDMHDENGNMPFVFPGKCNGKTDACADYDRINPAYWQNADKKMDWLWRQGFVPYLETVRRDHLHTWVAYHDFKRSFSRLLLYYQARYGTYNWIYSVFHFDTPPFLKEKFVEAVDHWYDTYGPMPFGQPTTIMSSRSSLEYFGHTDVTPWLKIHTSGNSTRNHAMYKNIENHFRQSPAVPAFNNEPYYVGVLLSFNKIQNEYPELNSDRDNYFGRAQMWGSVLSGGLAGHVYGSLSWPGFTTGEPDSYPRYGLHYWKTFEFDAHGQMRHFKDFILSEGKAYRDLVPASEDLQPRYSPAGEEFNLDGWAFMMRAKDKTLAYLYFENLCQKSVIHHMIPYGTYSAQWFNPRTGHFSNMGQGVLIADRDGKIRLPDYPGGNSQTSDNQDWAAKLVLQSR